MRKRIARAVLIGLSLVSVALMGMVLYPFASALLFAAVLAGAFLPAVDRLAATLGGRRPAAAGLTTAAVTVLIVLPVCLLAIVLGREAVLLYLTGHPTQALVLSAWGIVLVGLSDNLVKPLLMRGRMEVHAAVIFFALVGGLAAFGPAGLVAGPLVVAFFLASLRMCRRDLREAEVEEAGSQVGPRRRTA